jgi:aspartyl-tRNA(Asn)/glutamyl-tRNA(Gln) amidotransferase subunit A
VSGIRDGELETAAEMAAAIRGGEVGAVELIERSVERLHTWQPVTNAFSQMWEAEALAAAREVPGQSGIGAGVPLAIKDLFDVTGRETTGCCLAYRGNVAERDARVVERLRRAGTVFLGKTNQHELAAGGTNLVSACGAAANPWDPTRMTGGSSGGSAAAVAAGIVPWALGSDTGGSIRIPSSMCGTFGLKPTTGALPLDGVLPLSPSMDCPGPIAATARDLHLLYDVMAGNGSGRVPPEGSVEALRSVRVAVPGDYFADRVHREVHAVVDEVATSLEKQGAVVERIDGDGIEDSRRVWSRICYPEFGAAHDGLGIRWEDVAPSVRRWMEEGKEFDPSELASAGRRRQEIGHWFRDQLASFDVLLLPTTPYPAPRADEEIVDLGGGQTVEVASVGPGWLTCSVNLAGVPAVNLPAGRSSEGVPIGVSLVANDGQEDMLLRLAAAWESAEGYKPRRPMPTAGPG